MSAADASAEVNTGVESDFASSTQPERQMEAFADAMMERMLLNCTASYRSPQAVVAYALVTHADSGVRVNFTAYADYIVNDSTGKIEYTKLLVRYVASIVGGTGHVVIGGEEDIYAMSEISSDQKSVPFYSWYKSVAYASGSGAVVGIINEPVTIIGRAN